MKQTLTHVQNMSSIKQISVEHEIKSHITQTLLYSLILHRELVKPDKLTRYFSPLNELSLFFLSSSKLCRIFQSSLPLISYLLLS